MSERRIRGFVAVEDGFLLTVACPCGKEHHLAVRRLGGGALPAVA